MSSSSEDSRHCAPRSKRPRRSNDTADVTTVGPSVIADSNSSTSSECRLCRSKAQDLSLDFQLLESPVGLRAHDLCLLFSSGLHQLGEEDEGLKGFLPEDVRKELKRGNRLKCVYCKQKGATVGCAKPQCKKSYHLPCGVRNKSLQQHFDQFKSFCSSHRPVQKVHKAASASAEKKHRQSDGCVICLKNLEPKPSFFVLWAPCCGGWFHRTCVQKMALSAGAYHFRCPLCNDDKIFNREMLHFGIQLPQQDALWELEAAGSGPSDAIKPLSCSAKVCISERPDGREYNVPHGLWEVLACQGCGSRGIHVKCGGLEEYVDPDWYCYDCRGVVDYEKEKLKMAKPIKTVWGAAKAAKSGTHKSAECQREEIFRTIKLIVYPEPNGITLNPQTNQVLLQTRLPEVDHTLVQHWQPNSSWHPHEQSKDPMNVTLEDLIVNGLNREYWRPPAVPHPPLNVATKAEGMKVNCQSNFSADGEKSEEPETSPGDSDYESAQETGIASKIRKKSKVVISGVEHEKPETLNEKIQKTIKEFFHKEAEK